jgi:hypothetical protein
MQLPMAVTLFLILLQALAEVVVLPTTATTVKLVQ